MKAKVKVEPKKKPIKMQGGDSGLLSEKIRIIVKKIKNKN